MKSLMDPGKSKKSKKKAKTVGKKPSKKATKRKESDESRFSRIQKSLPYSIKCAYSKLIEVHNLTPHELNPNEHSEAQIALFAEIMKFQGVRRPITVSKRSGYVTKGHGQLQAMRLNGWDWAPVDVQDYEDDAQEYADIVADNALAAQSKLNRGKINEHIIDLGPELPVEMLGFKNFVVDPSELNDGKSAPPNHSSENKTETLKFVMLIETANLIRKAIHQASKNINFDNSSSQDDRATALKIICKRWLDDNGE